MVKIKRSAFRKGLQRANKIASFFAGRAATLHAGKWGIFELATEFDMSLAGSIGIATAGGTGVVELTYANPRFKRLAALLLTLSVSALASEPAVTLSALLHEQLQNIPSAVQACSLQDGSEY